MSGRWWAVAPRRLVALVGLLVWAVGAIVMSSLRVARDVVLPSRAIAPVVLVIPLRTRSRAETATLSGLVTLTPGTLPVGIIEQPAQLWVHGMYGRDPEALRQDILSMQTRVLRALRSPEPVEEAR